MPMRSCPNANTRRYRNGCESPYYFHLIRDYFTHTELILAGLWGGCTGVLNNADRIDAAIRREER